MGIREDREAFLRIGRRRTAGSGRRKLAFAVVMALALAMIALAATAGMRNSTPGPLSGRVSATTLIVDSVGDVGQYSSLNLFSNGAPEIVYYDVTNQALKVATWNGTGWQSTLPLESTPLALDDVGSYCSSVVNASDDTFVSALDATTSSLIFGTNVDNYSEVVDSASNAGYYTSIAVNNYTNTIVMSYYDMPNANLKYAENASGTGTWQSASVDTGGDVGMYSNIVIGYANDTISILYYDATNGDLKQAFSWGGGAWTKRVMDSVGDVGKWPAQAMRGTDWYAAYYDQTNGDLKYMDYVGGVGSAPVVVDSLGDVGQYASIAVNSTGVPFISYFDVTNGDLKLAWNDGGWKNITLDSTGDVGQFSSVAIDSSDIVHASYYDVTNGDLKYISIYQTDLTAAIPEFGSIVLPVVGLAMMVILVVASRREDE